MKVTILTLLISSRHYEPIFAGIFYLLAGFCLDFLLFESGTWQIPHNSLKKMVKGWNFHEMSKVSLFMIHDINHLLEPCYLDKNSEKYFIM